MHHLQSLAFLLAILLLVTVDFALQEIMMTRIFLSGRGEIR